MKNIYLVRHGESEFNKKKIFAGWSDCLLTEEGKRQAVDLRKTIDDLEIDVVYSSDLSRAKVTAEILNENKKRNHIVSKELREVYFGEWEGIDFERIEKEYSEVKDSWFKDYFHFTYPGGESMADMFERTKKYFDESIMTREEDNILIVAHAGVISSMISYLLFNNLELSDHFNVKNCTLTHIKMIDHMNYLEYFNK